jgi:hypothetical protein
LLYQTTTNQLGEVVTTSTSAQTIAQNIPEVSQVIQLINTKFSIDVTKSIKVVESKGTTTKEIKIVTTDSKNVDTTFTAHVDSTTVTIVNVQTITPLTPTLTAVPLPPTPAINLQPQ